jgi:hypothetical protein
MKVETVNRILIKMELLVVSACISHVGTFVTIGSNISTTVLLVRLLHGRY